MATNADTTSKVSTIEVTFIPNELAGYILQNMGKINHMLFENSCHAKFSESDNGLCLSFYLQQDYIKAFDILNEHIQALSHPQLSPVSVPPPPQPTPTLTSAEIELDETTHHYTISHLEEINQSLSQQFEQVKIEGAMNYKIKISGPDVNLIQDAFEFLKNGLEKIHHGNRSLQSDQTTDKQPQPIVHADTGDFKTKKWFIPTAMYELYQMEIDDVFKQYDLKYNKQITPSNTVLLEYGGECQVVENLKEKLDTFLKGFMELNQHIGYGAQPSTNTLALSDQPPTESYYSYQDDNQSDESLQSTAPLDQPNAHGSDAQFITNAPISNTNPFYESVQELTDSPTMDINSHPTEDDDEQKSGDVQTSSGDNSLNPVPIQEESPHNDPDSSMEAQRKSRNKPKRGNVLDNALKGQSSAATSSHGATSSSNDQSLTPEKEDGMKRQTDSTTVPVNTTSFNDPQVVDAISPSSQDTASQPGTRKREAETEQDLKRQLIATTPPSVSTSSFNDPQVVNAMTPTSPDAATNQLTPPNKPFPHDSPASLYSHQSFEAIIQFHDKYACVVNLPEGSNCSGMKNIEHTLLNLKVIQCPSQKRVFTLIADEKEIIKCALKELTKKFQRVGYLPPCNGVPIMTEAVKCFVEIDEKVLSQRSNCRQLASLTSSSGLKIMIKHMIFDDGKWDALVKSGNPNGIASARLDNANIFDVIEPDVDKAKSRHLTTSADWLDYWQFYVTDSKMKFCKRIIYFVLPGWNPDEFKSSQFKQAIKLILNYCNQKGLKTIAFPVLGHESKKIPIPLSAQALLQGIDEFSAHCPTPKLQQVDIVITRDTHIRSFLYHFITPIQNQIKSSKKKVASSDSVEEEDVCPICLQPLYSDDMPVRQLTKCKHQFHDECIARAVELKPICPLCKSSLGVERGNQPTGGIMTHSTTFNPLPGYHEVGTITIQYRIPGGVQNESHPNPGMSYSATSRTAYLPDNDKGRKVLSLLQAAFDRGLIFTVGTSRTLGVDNMITWNDIHHKTSYSGTHGYPDMDYLDRVLAELKDKGVQ